MKRVTAASAGFLSAAAILLSAACGAERIPLWESDNPVLPLTPPSLGIDRRLTTLPEPPTPERIRLGRWLFFDARVSEDGRQSCASCHKPDHGYSDTAPVSTFGNGLKTRRKAAAIVNAAWASPAAFYWDGRAGSLEAQAIGATENPIEVGGLHQAQTIVGALGEFRVYKRYFREAFGDTDVTVERVAKALADYQRSITSGDSAWDRWNRYGDQRAVSEEARAGDALFHGKAGCGRCHTGESFTDRQFHNLGVGWQPSKDAFADEGRFGVTKEERDRGAFKTPALRDVGRRAPYMHDGSIASLRAAVDWHVRGGRANPWLDPLLAPVSLTDAEVTALVAFLESLTSLKAPDMGPATFPR